MTYPICPFCAKEFIPAREAKPQRHCNAACAEADRNLHQLAVAKAIAEGLSRKETAGRFKLSVKTIDVHIRQFMDRYRLRTVQDVTSYFWQLGWMRLRVATMLVLSTVWLSAQPLPPAVTVSPNPSGGCQTLYWDYPTNRLGGTNAAGFVVAWGLNTNALTNEAWWGISTLAQSPVTNGSVTFSNAICGLWLTNTYWYRARTYTAANTTSVWWSAAVGIAPKTNLWIQLANQYAPTPAGPWTEDPASIRNLTNVFLYVTNFFTRTRFTKTPF